MNKPVVVLSISTALFAASTAYLALELNRRDAAALAAAIPLDAVTGHVSPGSSKPVVNAVPPGDGSPTQSALPVTVSSVPPARGDAIANSKSRDAQTEARDAFARQLVARYDDPNQRPTMLEELRSIIRRQYEKLKERLKLSDPEFEQLVTLFAEEHLQKQANWARCVTDPACDPKNPPNNNIDHTQEYQAMLGTDGAETFAQFRKSIAERDAVIQLRGRLPDSNFLPESQAEKLIVALAGERELLEQEIQARGGTMTGWGTQLGMLWYTEDSGLPEQYIAEATQYSQRLRARAASVLTPAQLAAYVQMQEELLAMFTTNVRPPSRQQKATVAQTS